MSMRDERTRAYLPRDAHPTGDGPAGSIKSDQETLQILEGERSSAPGPLHTTAVLFWRSPCGLLDDFAHVGSC